MSQQPLLFEPQPQSAGGDFLPTKGTQLALKLLQQHPQAGEVVVLVGPAGSGKSELLKLWAAHQGVVVRTLSDLQQLSDEPVCVVDDLQAGLSEDAQEQLFHLVNKTRNEGGKLLLASREPLQELVALPDLRTRLQAALVAEVQPPNTAELKQLMVKWAAERQLNLSAQVQKYMLDHTDRSAVHLAKLMAALDKLSLQEKRKISTSLVKDLLK